MIALYKEFYEALYHQGIFITSFLTPFPVNSKESSWKNFDIEDVRKQKAIFSDILEVKWQAFRTETQTKIAGFRVLEVIYDSQGMFPTIIAQKNNTDCIHLLP